jgi:hypothetical protein
MTRQVSVTLSSPEYDKDKTIAKAREISVAQLLRDLLYAASLPAEQPWQRSEPHKIYFHVARLTRSFGGSPIGYTLDTLN